MTVAAEMVPETMDGARFVAARAAQWSNADANAATTAPAATALLAAAAIDLSGDSLNRPTPAHIIAATVAALMRGETHYTARPGILPLRRAVAAAVAVEGGAELRPHNGGTGCKWSA